MTDGAGAPPPSAPPPGGGERTPGGGGGGGGRRRGGRGRGRGGGPGGEQAARPEAGREAGERREGQPRQAGERREGQPRQAGERREGQPRQAGERREGQHRQGGERREGPPRQGGERREGQHRGEPRGERRDGPRGEAKGERREGQPRGSGERREGPPRGERREGGRAGGEPRGERREGQPRGERRPEGAREGQGPRHAGPRAATQGQQRPAAPSSVESTAGLPGDEGWDDPSPTSGAEATALETQDEAPPPRPRPAAPPPRPADPDGEEIFTADLEPPEPRTDRTLYNVVALRFRPGGSLHTFDAGELALGRGEKVVVDSDRGQLVAEVVLHARRMAVSDAPRRVVRRATTDDLATLGRAEGRTAEILATCRRVARERRMPIKMVRVEPPLGQGRTLIFFASEERVDFRDLARELQQVLGTRIELKQLGARDEAKVVGGIGSCGRELCCSTFLPSFVPISIKAAKDQGLALTPTKVSGQCGRLKCCLVYEHDLYKEMRRDLPKQGKRVHTPGGPGRVVEVDVLKQRVCVVFEEGGREYFPGNVVTPMFPSQQATAEGPDEPDEPSGDETPPE